MPSRGGEIFEGATKNLWRKDFCARPPHRLRDGMDRAAVLVMVASTVSASYK